MLRLVMLVVLLGLAWTANAQVYKCVKGKETSYQSQPCAPDQATEKAWAEQRYAPPSNADLWRNYYTQQATQQRDAELRGGYAPQRRSASVATGAVVSRANGGACEAAKRTRDAELERTRPRQGHSVKALRSWDNYVAKACK